MNNKTEVFDVQREIAQLKRRVETLEQRGMQFAKVTDWPGRPPIFGPQDDIKYASGCDNVPFDAYKTNLSNYQPSEALLKAMDKIVANLKENKLD